jgi:hypothetical protein
MEDRCERKLDAIGCNIDHIDRGFVFERQSQICCAKFAVPTCCTHKLIAAITPSLS